LQRSQQSNYEGNYKGITSDNELSIIEKEMVQTRESEQQQRHLEEVAKKKNSFDRKITITTKNNATAKNTTTTAVTNKRISTNQQIQLKKLKIY
jgi:hypothetical protein